MTLAIVQPDNIENFDNEAALKCPETGHDIKVSFREVTPAQALVLLGKNHPRNRAISQTSVACYAEQMLNGEWHPASGEAIKISDKPDEVLIDGQHRLHAVIKADKPITFMFIEGVPERAFSAIDDGVLRSLSAVLEINGIKVKGGAQRAASTLKTLIQLQYSVKNNVNHMNSRSHKVSSTMALKFHQHAKGFNAAMDHFCSQFNVGSIQDSFNTPTLIAMYYLFSGIDETTDNALFTICQSIETGTPFDGLKNKSPCYHIMKQIRANRDKKLIMRAGNYIELFVWALEQTLRGEPVDRLPAVLPNAFDTHIDAVRLAKEKLLTI